MQFGVFFFFSSRRRHTRSLCDWSSDVCSSDLKASSALAIATSACVNYLYASNSGHYGEAGVFEGHLTTINLATGAQNVFNIMCSNQTTHLANPPSTPNCGTHSGLETGGGGVWGRPGVIYDQALDRIFIVTGNGDYNPTTHDWSDSVVALDPG